MSSRAWFDQASSALPHAPPSLAPGVANTHSRPLQLLGKSSMHVTKAPLDQRNKVPGTPPAPSKVLIDLTVDEPSATIEVSNIARQPVMDSVDRPEPDSPLMLDVVDPSSRLHAIKSRSPHQDTMPYLWRSNCHIQCKPQGCEMAHASKRCTHGRPGYCPPDPLLCHMRRAARQNNRTRMASRSCRAWPTSARHHDAVKIYVKAVPGTKYAELEKESSERDLDELRDAVKICVKAVADTKYAELEKAFCEHGLNFFIVTYEREQSETYTLIDLRGHLGKKYTIGFFKRDKAPCSTTKEGWPASPEENMARLADAGVPVDTPIRIFPSATIAIKSATPAELAKKKRLNEPTRAKSVSRSLFLLKIANAGTVVR